MAEFVIDTSVWIDYFRARLNPVVEKRVDHGLENDLIILTDIIKHELLVGTTDERQYRNMIDLLSPLPVIRVENSELDKFNHFAWQVRKQGLGGKYTDINIAYLCSTRKLPILSLDGYFRKLAQKNWVKTL